MITRAFDMRQDSAPVFEYNLSCKNKPFYSN